jgi:hypothetical protein
MTIQFRRKLLAFFILLFIVFGAGIVLYSQGYRLDMGTFSVTKIGAIYIESYQNPITIYLNDTVYKDKTGILTKGTLISSVIPKKYQLTIRKDGFYDYQKNIEVLPSQVVRFFNVLLVPKEIASTTIVLTSSTNQTIDDITSSAILTHLSTAKGTQWFLYPLTQSATQASSTTSTPLAKTLASVSRQKFGSVLLYNSPSQLLATTSAGMYKITTGAKTASQLIANNSFFAYAYTMQDGNLLSVVPQPQPAPTTTPLKTAVKTKQIKDTNPLASLTRININSGASTTLSFVQPHKVKDIQLITEKDNLIAFITVDKSLILFNTDKNTETIISKNVVSALFSPDNNKLLYREPNGKTHIYFIKNELETADARAGDDIILSLNNISAIHTILWYQDSAHLLLFYPSHITLAEMTKKQPNNQFTLWRETYNKTFYANDTNILTISTPLNKIYQIDLKLFTK